MAEYIQYSINVEYEDHAHGKVETRTETFTGGPGEVPNDMLATIEKWRYDNGYVIKTELIPSNFTAAKASE